MSYAHVTAIRANRGLTQTQKLVAIMVSDHAGAEGCWATAQTLADECGITRRAMVTALRDLLCCGAIRRIGERRTDRGPVPIYAWGLVTVETSHKGCTSCTRERASHVNDDPGRCEARSHEGVNDVPSTCEARSHRNTPRNHPDQPPHGTTPETRATPPAAEELRCNPDPATEPPAVLASETQPAAVTLSTALTRAFAGSAPAAPASAASPTASASSRGAEPADASAASTPTASSPTPTPARSDGPTTAHPCDVVGRPPTVGSGDGPIATAWATARMQRLDPTRITLDRSDARAIEQATRRGATLADLEVIGAWLEGPDAEWWQAKGYAVASWRQVLGADGAKWEMRIRDTKARPVVQQRAASKAAAAGRFFEDLADLETEVIDVQYRSAERADDPARRLGLTAAGWDHGG